MRYSSISQLGMNEVKICRVDVDPRAAKEKGKVKVRV
jgi:hypothetical protein